MRGTHSPNTEALTQTEWIIRLIWYRVKGIAGWMPGSDACFQYCLSVLYLLAMAVIVSWKQCRHYIYCPPDSTARGMF